MCASFNAVYFVLPLEKPLHLHPHHPHQQYHPRLVILSLVYPSQDVIDHLLDEDRLTRHTDRSTYVCV